MRHTPERHRDGADRTVKDIRRKTRKRYSSEDKIRIVLAGLRGEDTIAELCRQEGIAQSQYYCWSKEFMEAGRKRLAGDTAREANTGEVQELPNVKRWLDQLEARPALARGAAVPHETNYNESEKEAERVETTKNMVTK